MPSPSVLFNSLAIMLHQEESPINSLVFPLTDAGRRIEDKNQGRKSESLFAHGYIWAVRMTTEQDTA
jgi:hypothetical protein